MTDMSDNLPRSDEEWKQRLTPERFGILRKAGTEAPWTGKLLGNKGEGEYVCGACHAALFDSDTKYDSGSGWPSFTAPIRGNAVEEHTDVSHGMERTEVRCARCGSHLGHVFPDGPGPEGLRYCVNSASLDFMPADEDGEVRSG